MRPRLLAIYLNDHLAGAMAGVELARRARGSNEGTDLGDYLTGLVEAVEADREALLRIMDRLEVRADPIKRTLGWAAEKVGRLKPNGQLVGYSPLSRLVELEGLHAGVSGKLSLWQVLDATAGAELTDFDLTGLAARAREQLEQLERFRLEAARTAFADEPSSAQAADTG
jgi:hypothetical protein